MWRDHVPEHRTRPPQLRGVMERPHLLEALKKARLTVVQAPAGYGKTSLLYRLYHSQRCLWYSLDADDPEPLSLVGGLALGLERLGVGHRLNVLLEEHAPLHRLVDALIDVMLEHQLTLIIDEAQHLPESPHHGVVRKLLEHAQVVLGTRRPLELPELVRARVSGELTLLSSHELGFSRAELEALLQQAQVQLTAEEVQLCINLTEGWPIAVRFLVQALVGGRINLRTLEDFELRGTGLGEFFTYVTQEVLEPLPPQLQQFLRQSSIFEVLTPEIMEEVLDEPLARDHLEALTRTGTFLSLDSVGGYHAHVLLRANLRNTLSEEEQRRIADRGARAYEKRGRYRNALNAHLLSGNLQRAAELLCDHGQRWLQEGRTRTVSRALSLLHDLWDDVPLLHALQGDVLRSQSRYAGALECYRKAPLLEALLGEAQVYLDTVSPRHAEPLLQRALQQASTPADHQRILAMLAENALNRGKVAEVQQLAAALPPQMQPSPARMLLRSGRLQEALHAATHASRDEKGHSRQALGHREGLLLASLLHAFLGSPQQALDCATEGIRESERLHSPFSLSLAYARLGHALICLGQFEKARAAYQTSLEQARGTDAPRLLIEAQMGLAHLDARLSGRGEDTFEQARQVLQDGGDRWMAGLMQAFYAYGLKRSNSQKALQVLQEAQQAFEDTGDPFGLTVCHLLHFLLTPGQERARQLLNLLIEQDAGFLLLQPGLFHPFDHPSEPIKALIQLRQFCPEHAGWLELQAAKLGYPVLPEKHPGYTLKVELLGTFRAYRDQQQIEDWGRARARDLLALLVLSPQGISREEAIEALYPEESPEIAERNFRIVLHALGQVLEGEEAKGYFLERGDLLRLKPSPDLQVDLWTVQQALQHPLDIETLLAFPLNLTGQFDLAVLEEARSQYRTTLERVLVRTGEAQLTDHPALAQRLAERALMLEPAAEEATRLLMRSAHLQGQMDLLHRSYLRCEAALQELGLTPSGQTRQLYQALNRALLH